MRRKTYPPRRCPVTDPDRQIERPVFGVDIDGTLGNYWQHFIRFAEQWTGREMAPWHTAEPGMSLAEHCGLSKTTYRRIKLAYRQGGMKRSMPIFDGAASMVRSLRVRGAEVWLCTTRPYLQVSGVEEDTRHWLRRHGITYDGFLFGEHKYRDLARTVGAHRVASILEDLDELVEQARGLGFPTVQVAQPYNSESGKWADMPSAEQALLTRLDYWEDYYRGNR